MQLKFDVTLGIDVPAYLHKVLTVDVPDANLRAPGEESVAKDPAAVQAAIDLAKAEALRVQKERAWPLFSPDVDEATGLRITSICLAGTQDEVATDIPLARSAEDLGLVTLHVLSGVCPPRALLIEAQRQGIAVSWPMEQLLRQLDSASA